MATSVTRETVGKWRERFVERRLEALHDEPRPGAPRKISDDQIERLMVKTLEIWPRKATHCSTTLMAEATGISKNQVHRIWKAFGLKPHLTETVKLSQDPLFIENVRDVVGLYMAPPECAMVLCVDETTQVQALDRTQPLLPMGRCTDTRGAVCTCAGPTASETPRSLAGAARRRSRHV